MRNFNAAAWLLEEVQPAVKYYALVDLFDHSKNDIEVRETYSNIPRKGFAFDMLSRQKPEGHWESMRNLYRPKYTSTNWMALVLSDLGLTKDNVKIRKVANLFFQRWMREDRENIFQDEVCVVGNTARMLIRFGYEDDPRVKKLLTRLLEDQKEDGGWHCFESSKGTLDCWEALAAFAALPKSKRTRLIKNSIERGAEFYLNQKLFDDGEPRYAPWFRFHYPNHYYYDLLVGLDIVTSLGYARDKRLTAALDILRSKRRKDGKWLQERVHPDPSNYFWGKGNLQWKIKPFSLEPAGKPSKWITLKALRVLKRVEDEE